MARQNEFLSFHERNTVVFTWMEVGKRRKEKNKIKSLISLITWKAIKGGRNSILSNSSLLFLLILGRNERK